MPTLEASTLYTPEDLLTMPAGDQYELIDGRLVERNMGAWSSYVGFLLACGLKIYCNDHFLGWVWSADASYQCFPARPRLVRKPDVSFIRLGRLPGEQAPGGIYRSPPTWPSRSSLRTTWLMRLTNESPTTSARAPAWFGS
jgi:Uma2 family endonuclease